MNANQVQYHALVDELGLSELLFVRSFRWYGSLSGLSHHDQVWEELTCSDKQ